MSEQEQHLAQMTAEKNDLENTHPMAAKLLQDEIDRIQSGGQEKFTFVELHHPKTKVEYRVKIPIKEFPQVNFVGKILGEKGGNLQQLQQATGCRIAVLGRGSMRDKAKQEELRLQGGKYSHFNYDLHLWFETVGHPVECYQKIAHAFQVLHPYLVPDPSEIQPQNGGMMMRGGPRGGMRGRGGRGMPRGSPMMGRGGGGGGGAQMMRGGGGGGYGGGRPPMRGVAGGRGGRGGPMAGRGAAVGGRGGAPRGGAGGLPSRGSRGASVGASGMAPQQAQSYTDSYEYTSDMSGYGAGYGDAGGGGYADPNAMAAYGSATGQASDAYQYESYGQAAGAEAGYGSYDSGWGAEGGDASGYGKAAAPSRGGMSNYRTRPY